MKPKEQAKKHCIAFLHDLQLSHIFDNSEFERMFKGCSQLNPFSVGLSIADNLIRIANNKIYNND